MSLSQIQSQISKAAQTADRASANINLLAVSKVQPLDRVVSVLNQGHRLFGENRVQEAQERWTDLIPQYDGISVHLIGPLQTNKIKLALDLFYAIHSIDRPKLAAKLASEIQTRGTSPELFIQINTGEEPQKAGCLPGDADAFIADCRAMDLQISGLMVIPPIDQEPSLHFALLRKIAERNGLSGLSMGMSADFERAIALGATHIRVGSAIFGQRIPATGV